MVHHTFFTISYRQVYYVSNSDRWKHKMPYKDKNSERAIASRKAAVKRFQKKDPEAYRAYQREWHRKQPKKPLTSEEKEKERLRHVAYRAKNPEKMREIRRNARERMEAGRNMKYLRKSKYGLTHEEYEALVIAQNNFCAICGNPETRSNGKGGLNGLYVYH